MIGGLLAMGIAITACSSTPSNTATNGTAATPSDGVSASQGPTTTWAGDQPGVQHLDFKYGPITIQPGQNNIDTKLDNIPKPDVDGWIVGINPNLTRTDGSIPGVDVIHLHHGVWLNLSHQDPTSPGLPERFFASGEEKTVEKLPNGYGYQYKASDKWALNYMLHNLTPNPDQVFITYTIDFIPADSPLANGIKPAHPIWMDVENGEVYPVFDALKGSGHNGQFTFPDDDPNAYADRAPKGGGRRNATTTDPSAALQPNQWVVPQDATLIGTGGHLHPGGLHDDLWLTRPGASATPGSDAASEVNGDKAHLFQSNAQYFEPAGAVSWDVALEVTPADYRVKLKQGDILSTTTTYDVSNASWYENMGIMVSWIAYGDDATAGAGADPFQTKVAVKGQVTHGHLNENNNHGGQPSDKYLDLTKAPASTPTNTVNIADFVYAPGDMLNGSSVPTVKPGGSLTFTNADDKSTPTGLWHTITACKTPCNQSTGIAYPLANADTPFDSGELGTGGAPASGKVDWTIPSNLPDGTYTYFCRIHPFMRGAFRVADDGTSGTSGSGGQ
jgi:plastocyanin